MTLNEHVQVLFNEYKELLSSSISLADFDSTFQTLNNAKEEAYSYLNFFIPKKALTDLNTKNRINWPQGSGSYYSDRDIEIKKKTRENRYGFETELLNARHPRKVQRLFDDAKPIIEERYGRTFNSRNDFYIMHVFFEHYLDIEKSFENLSSVINFRKSFAEPESIDFSSFLSEELRDKIHELSSHAVIHNFTQASNSVLSLFNDIANPNNLLNYNNYDGWDVMENVDLSKMTPELDLYFSQAFNDFEELDFRFNNVLSNVDVLTNISSLLIKLENKTATFPQVLGLFEPNYLSNWNMLPSITRDTLNMDFHGFNYDLPDDLQDFFYSKIGEFYENRDNEPEVKTFFEKYSSLILKRWQDTAADYDKLFQFHYPNSRDQEMLRLFHKIREGKMVFNDDRINIGRIPLVLEYLVQDGIIEPKDIDPPLKSNYLKPDEVLSNASLKTLPSATKEAISNLSVINSPEGIIDIGADISNLPVPTNFPEKLISEDDFSKLYEFLDPSKEYILLDKGKHSIFFCSTFHHNKIIGLDKIYRFNILKPEAKAKDGIEIIIGGNKINIQQEAMYERNWEFLNKVVDSNDDSLKFRSYNAIIDISVDEFMKVYHKDFLMHALVHYDDLEFDKFKNVVQKVGRHKEIDINMRVEPFGRVIFKMFEVAGKPGFSLTHKSEFWVSEGYAVKKTLTDYLDEVGLDFYYEYDLDEHGRDMLAYKLEERKFQEEHFQEISDYFSSPDNFIKTMSYLLDAGTFLSSSKEPFYINNFGESSNLCKTCNKIYIEGTFSERESYSGIDVDLKDIHDLSNHAFTFVNRFSNLRRIKNLVEVSKDYEPKFLLSNDIESEFSEFAYAYDDYLEKSAVAFNDYLSGDIEFFYEPEEIEDNPDLKNLVEKERLHKLEESDAEKIMYDAVDKLHNTYQEAIGKSVKFDSNIEKANFWAKQIHLLSVYRISNQKSLPQNISQKTINLPANFKTS